MVSKILKQGNALERKVSANGGKGHCQRFCDRDADLFVGAMAIMGALKAVKGQLRYPLCKVTA